MMMTTSRCHRRRAATCASHYCRAISSACVSPTPPPLPKKYAFAIVGSGPAGMYAVEKLLNLERKTVKGKTTDSDTTPTTHSTTMKKVVIRVDVYEKECFPYGLVRYGVAPDHAATKNVTNKFDALLRDARVRLFANVKVGDEASRVDAAAADDDADDDDDKSLRVSTKELLKNYSGVVLAHGAADNDRKLQIENEDRLRGVYGARQFVNWFNGLPSAAPMRNKEMHEDIVDRLQRKKKGTNVVIVGVGNVALDCARILLRSTEELKETDIASHALEALEKANVKSVTIIGRRSVAQAKFSPKELREVIGLPNLDVQIDDLEVAEEDVEEMNASRPRRRAFEVLEKAKKAVATDGDVEGKKKKKKTLRVLFLRSPTALLPEVDDDDANPSSLGFVKIRKNILEGPTGNRKAKTLSDDLVGSEDETILPCDILIRSVGYVGDKLEPSLIPSDNNGTIAHDGLGRVQYKTDDSSATGRLYVCGWAKRGASGVIATNVQCAEETALAIEEDILNDILKPVVVRENNTNDEPSSLLQKSGGGAGDDKDDKKNHRLLVTAAKWFELDAVERGGGLCSKDDDDDDKDDKDDDDGKRTPSSSSSARRRTTTPRPGSRRIKIVDRDRALAFLQSRRFV